MNTIDRYLYRTVMLYTAMVLAVLLTLGGLSMLTILTASITSAFIAYRQDQNREQGQDTVAGQLEQISSRLETIETELRNLRAAGTPESQATE